jgi:CheY-like chemotaxis protein
MTRVLVVDDALQIVRALRGNLLARSFEVVTAGTGRGALDAAKADHPDVVLLDLGLPDLDGVDVVGMGTAYCPTRRPDRHGMRLLAHALPAQNQPDRQDGLDGVLTLATGSCPHGGVMLAG